MMLDIKDLKKYPTGWYLELVYSRYNSTFKNDMLLTEIELRELEKELLMLSAYIKAHREREGG